MAQCGGNIDSGEEDAGAIEAASAMKPDWDSGRLDRAEVMGNAPVVLDRRFTKELEGNVPGFGRCPAKIVVGRTQGASEALQHCEHVGIECNRDEESH